MGEVTDELLALGEADWRAPPSSKTALSSSLMVSFPNSTKLISECLLQNIHIKRGKPQIELRKDRGNYKPLIEEKWSEIIRYQERAK